MCYLLLLVLVDELFYETPVHELLDTKLCFVRSVISYPILREIVSPDLVAPVHRSELALAFDSYALHVLVKVYLEQAFTNDL